MNDINFVHGIWRVMPSPNITEIIAQSGFDFQIFDLEHGGYDFNTLYADICACELNNSVPFVRVSGINKVEVQRCLDLGAKGIVFPQLNSFEDFKTASEMLIYSPDGIRGFNPFVRSNGYGIPNSLKYLKPKCITIIESLEAVNELENIVKLSNIDMVYIGVYDLSAQIGCIGDMENVELNKIVNKIIKICIANGMKISIMVHSANQFQLYKEKGISTFVHAVDSFKIKSFFVESLLKYKN
jgi:2-keto-3-deoxy-L-rhamnonate aldolase RhmA